MIGSSLHIGATAPHFAHQIPKLESLFAQMANLLKIPSPGISKYDGYIAVRERQIPLFEHCAVTHCRHA